MASSRRGLSSDQVNALLFPNEENDEDDLEDLLGKGIYSFIHKLNFFSFLLKILKNIIINLQY